MSEWRSRIVGHGEEAPDQLLANPGNWRIHPKGQQDAMSGALNQIGWVQQVIVNRTTGHVVDGHMRVALALSKGEKLVPVTYVELDASEEAAVLASFDPLGGMAVSDRETLTTLLDGVEVSDSALLDLLDDVRAKYGSIATTDAVPFKGDYIDSPEEAAARATAVSKGRTMRELSMIMDDEQYARATELVAQLRTKWGLQRLVEVVLTALERCAE